VINLRIAENCFQTTKATFGASAMAAQLAEISFRKLGAVLLNEESATN
jgi:hypothetical protein